MANATQISWTDPTTNTDGSAVASGEVTGYLVGVRLASGSAGVYPYTVSVAPTSLSAPLSSLAPTLPSTGSFLAAVEALSANSSGWSVEAAFTLAATPNPPQAVTVS